MSKTYRQKMSHDFDSEFNDLHPKMKKKLKEEKRNDRARRDEKRIFLRTSKENHLTE